MKISLIAALAKNRVIGLNNKMPWHLPADLKNFKKITMNKPIIMGRKTFQSIGKALPGRVNIIITRDQAFVADHCEIAHSLDEALDIAKNKLAHENDEIMIIGGGNLYEQTLAMASRCYLSYIDLDTEGEAFFPEWNPAEWEEISRETYEPDEKNLYSYAFVILERHSK